MKKTLKFVIITIAGALMAIISPHASDAAVYTVTNEADTNTGSLRWAIEQANLNPGEDTIIFNNNYTISPGSGLPPLQDQTGGTTIDGGIYKIIISGPSSSPYGLKIESNNNTIRNLHIRNMRYYSNGTFGHGNGIYIVGNDNNIISCHIYANQGFGIVLGDLGTLNSPRLMYEAFTSNGYGFGSEVSNNRIQSSIIGTSDGETPSSATSYQSGGVFGTEKAINNIIGVDGDGNNDIAEGNTISSNSRQISFYGPGNIIAGNKIGTDSSGSYILNKVNISAPYSNDNGIYLGQNAFNTIIGTNSDGISDDLERNIISGNGTGIEIQGFTDGVRISGNYIGLNAAGTATIPNMTGIFVHNDSYWPSGSYPAHFPDIQSPVVIGTNGDGIRDEIEGNVIAGLDVDSVYSNQPFGIRIRNTNYNGTSPASGNGKDGGVKISGNYIGTDASGLHILPLAKAIHVQSSHANIIGTDGDGVSDALEGNVIGSDVVLDYSGSSIDGNGSDYNRISGNHFGLDKSGTQVLSYDGELYNRAIIQVKASKYNVIGTNGDGVADDLEGNVFAMVKVNSYGNDGLGSGLIHLAWGGDNRISGNRIGLTSNDESLLGPEARGSNPSIGIWLLSETNSLIGTDGDGVSDELEGNVLLGSQVGIYGIGLSIGGNNRVSGNFVGTSKDGLINSGFGGSGIFASSPNTLIGTDHDGTSDFLEGNVVANNGYNPIFNARVDDGVTVYSTYYNTIQGNSIYNNAGLGIDLVYGGNSYFPSPVINSITHNGVSFVVSGSAPVGSMVEIFIADSDPSGGGGEGKIYLDRTLAAEGTFLFYLDTIGSNDFLTATATSPSGNTSKFSGTLDFSGHLPPVLDPIGDKTVDTGTMLSFDVTASSPHGDPVEITTPALPLGATFDGTTFSWIPDYGQAGFFDITFNASDGLSASSETITITVNIVNSFPVVVPSGTGNYTLQDEIILGAQVSDDDGDLLQYEWSENGIVICSGSTDSIEGGSLVALPDCSISAAGQAIGQHLYKLEVSDGFNPPVINHVELSVQDTSAPTLAPVIDQTTLWPPNHKMVDVLIDTNAADDSSCLSLEAELSSNEPEVGLSGNDEGPDFTAPVIDAETGSINFQLRAERDGEGVGRTYEIIITATDCAGNSSSTTIEVDCPHDQRL